MKDQITDQHVRQDTEEHVTSVLLHVKFNQLVDQHVVMELLMEQSNVILEQTTVTFVLHHMTVCVTTVTMTVEV